MKDFEKKKRKYERIWIRKRKSERIWRKEEKVRSNLAKRKNVSILRKERMKGFEIKRKNKRI